MPRAGLVRLFSVCLCGVILGLCGRPSLQAAESAAQLYSRARQAEKRGDVVKAYLLYAEAAALDPKDRKAWAHSLALRTQAALKAKVMPGDSASGSADPEPLPTDAEPLDTLPEVTPADLAEAAALKPPVRLRPTKGQHDFSLQGDSKAIWEQAAKAYGLDVIFDGDYQPLPDIRFRIQGVEATEAFRALELATASFLVPITNRLLLVARENTQKRQDLEQTIAITVPIPAPVGLPEAQELARSVQQLMDIQRFGIDSVRRVVVIKDRLSKVAPAVALLDQLLAYRPEVVLEIEFIEVLENSALDYGLRLPTSTGLAWFGNLLGFKTTPTIPTGFTNFIAFGGGKTLFGLGVASAELFATFSKGSTSTLLRSEIRSSDGQPAQFHVGDKYPIMTTGYFGTTQGTGTVYAPPPAFNFEDLGVALKITPKVHGWDEMSLDVEADYKVLTGDALNGIPIIASRKFQSRTRVRAGEWAVLAGLVRATEARVLTGLAGVSSIPALGALFRQNSKSSDRGQTLFVIKPRLLSPPLTEMARPPLMAGTETRPRLVL